MIHRYEYTDFADFLRALDAPPQGKAATRGRSSEETDADRAGRTKFTGTRDYPEAARLVIDGAPELEARIRALSEGLTLDVRGQCESRTETRFDVSGDDVDIARYLEDEPECMMIYEPVQRAGGRIIHFAVQAFTPWSTSADVIERRGAAVGALVDALEAAGHRVAVTAHFGVKSLTGYDQIAANAPVKLAQELLDMTRLAFVLAHPAMLRRMWFRWGETLRADIVDAFGYHKGQCYSFRCDHNPPPCDVFLSDADSPEFSSDAAARTWIVKQFHRLTDSGE